MRTSMLMIVLPVLLAVPLAASPPPDPAASGLSPQQYVDARRAGMRLSFADIILMRRAAEKGADIRQMASAATAVSQWGAVIPSLFPPGTGPDAAQTAARPEIWSNRADFEQRARDFSAAATQLSQSLAAGDMASAGANWDATWNGCNGCHERYRREAPPPSN